MMDYRLTNPKTKDTGTFCGKLPPKGTLRAYIQDEDFDKAIHLTTFYTFIGLKHEVLTLEETLGDYGLLHALTHFVNNIDHWTYSQITKEELCKISDEIEHKLAVYENN